MPTTLPRAGSDEKDKDPEDDEGENGKITRNRKHRLRST
jgi:hypothetical protein